MHDSGFKDVLLFSLTVKEAQLLCFFPLFASLVCRAPFINRSVQEGSCLTASLAPFSIHKTILAAFWLLWQHTDGHIVPEGNIPIHPTHKCAHGAFWGAWGRIMKKLLCVGYIASLLSEILSACVCTPSGTLMKEDNDEPCACVCVCMHTCACAVVSARCMWALKQHSVLLNPCLDASTADAGRLLPSWTVISNTFDLLSARSGQQYQLLALFTEWTTVFGVIALSPLLLSCPKALLIACSQDLSIEECVLFLQNIKLCLACVLNDVLQGCSLTNSSANSCSESCHLLFHG